MSRYRQHFTDNIDDPTWLKIFKVKSDEFMDTLIDNTTNLTEALDRNSKSSSFLARVGIVISIVGALATALWARYTYLTYIH